MTKKVRIISLVRDTLTGPLFFIPTKYCQNMSKGIKVIERTVKRLWTNGKMDRRTDGLTG